MQSAYIEIFILLCLDEIAFDSLARPERFHAGNTHLLLLRTLSSTVHAGSEAKRKTQLCSPSFEWQLDSSDQRGLRVILHAGVRMKRQTCSIV